MRWNRISDKYIKPLEQVLIFGGCDSGGNCGSWGEGEIFEVDIIREVP